MTANELFKAILKDSLFQEKYNLSEEKLKNMVLHEESSSDIVEIIKLVIQGIENRTPERSINSQVKNYFKI